MEITKRIETNLQNDIKDIKDFLIVGNWDFEILLNRVIDSVDLAELIGFANVHGYSVRAGVSYGNKHLTYLYFEGGKNINEERD